MIITVGEIIETLHERKSTCVLTFQIQNQAHLLRIYFNHGDIRHLSFGDTKNAACFPLLRGFTYKQYSFIKDVISHFPPAVVNSADALEQIRKIDKTVAGDSDNVYGQTIYVDAFEPGTIEMVQERFAAFVGPVAPILLDQCLVKIGCPRGAKLSKGVLKLILGALSEELSQKERAVFAEGFRV